MDRLCVVCCTVTYDLYMVHDHVWPFDKNDVAHLTCLEQTLERRLTIDDFTDRQINNMIRFGYNLEQER